MPSSDFNNHPVVTVASAAETQFLSAASAQYTQSLVGPPSFPGGSGRFLRIARSASASGNELHGAWSFRKDVVGTSIGTKALFQFIGNLADVRLSLFLRTQNVTSGVSAMSGYELGMIHGSLKLNKIQNGTIADELESTAAEDGNGPGLPSSGESFELKLMVYTLENEDTTSYHIEYRRQNAPGVVYNKLGGVTDPIVGLGGAGFGLQSRSAAHVGHIDDWSMFLVTTQ